MNSVGQFVLSTLAILAMGLVSSQALAQNAEGPTTTVSFGQWMTSTPLNRWPNSSPTRTNNRFAMGPNHVTIKVGESVTFVVSGLHNIAIYDDATLPSDINIALVTNTTGTPNTVPVIDDPRNRIYWGLDPTLQALDRIEVVRFAKPGIYLVICGIRPHFEAGMYGYVEVVAPGGQRAIN